MVIPLFLLINQMSESYCIENHDIIFKDPEQGKVNKTKDLVFHHNIKQLKYIHLLSIYDHK
jgi:hypothetical protein